MDGKNITNIIYCDAKNIFNNFFFFWVMNVFKILMSIK